MVKCPNCGSSAQMLKIGDEYPTYNHIIETWRCGCGCVVRRVMKTTDETVTLPEWLNTEKIN